LEGKHRLRTNYMAKQREINPHMRAILVDWLMEVVSEFKLEIESFFATISYIDRFLSLMHVIKSKLQLVAIACMLIATKYEEMYPPLLDDFVYICDGTYEADEVRRMELQVLLTLKFDANVASSDQFLARFIRCVPTDKKTCCLAQYLIEISLMEYNILIVHLPSQIAASALVLALYSFGHVYWNPTLRHYTGMELTFDVNLYSRDVSHVHREFQFQSSSNPSKVPT